MASIGGLHHVTCIAGEAQENLDFYAGVLGMRLVKRTVNQDVPDSYHLFYADGEGRPGTDLTFFPWPKMGPGQSGIGLAQEVQLAVPAGTLEGWQERLERRGVEAGAVEERFGERVLPLRDPHGLRLSLAELLGEREFTPWPQSSVPESEQIRGLHAVRLCERELGPTAAFLTEAMGFEQAGVEDGWRRYQVAGGGSGRALDLKELPGERRGAWGVGSIHHVAWRVADLAAEMALRERVAEHGRRPTPLIDRFWFRSVYFTEPGGALFELATDGPGFTVDEEPEELGERLILPPWLEPRRARIELALPELRAPAGGAFRG
ncbi:MAG: ring-cleaving dioxygenase [Longimicrobiaceae bacterium]